MLNALSHLASRFRSIPAITCLSLSLFCSVTEGASITPDSQSNVEAAYLFDFGKFVRWPAGAGQGPMDLCVAGSPSVSADLEKIIANENIGGRRLEVHQVPRTEDVSDCAILFIDATQRGHVDEFLQAVADKPALTVSDLPDFLSRGGMIEFQLVAKRIRFSVDLAAVNRRHLIMSSELLKIAVHVTGLLPEGGAQ